MSFPGKGSSRSDNPSQSFEDHQDTRCTSSFLSGPPIEKHPFPGFRKMSASSISIGMSASSLAYAPPSCARGPPCESSIGSVMPARPTDDSRDTWQHRLSVQPKPFSFSDESCKVSASDAANVPAVLSSCCAFAHHTVALATDVAHDFVSRPLALRPGFKDAENSYYLVVFHCTAKTLLT